MSHHDKSTANQQCNFERDTHKIDGGASATDHIMMSFDLESSLQQPFLSKRLYTHKEGTGGGNGGTTQSTEKKKSKRAKESMGSGGHREAVGSMKAPPMKLISSPLLQRHTAVGNKGGIGDEDEKSPSATRRNLRRETRTGGGHKTGNIRLGIMALQSQVTSMLQEAISIHGGHILSSPSEEVN